MSKTILELKRIWDREKESYITQEIGSGVQSFVKLILECPDIFNLKAGSLSTLDEKRKREFIYEKRTKERRHADFTIYIDSEVVIPVEVEQYTNIKQGEKQLSQYQSDLDRKYGLLTDGFTWRFYNNNIYRPFNLDKIFSDTAYFLEFWNEYIKPENYYLSQFGEEVGQLPLFEKTELHIEDNRQLFFRDITKLIGSFKNKLRLEGYFNGVDSKEAEKRATEITYAYIIQFVLYKTLVDNKFEDFGGDYKSRLEGIQNAIKNRSYKEILWTIEGMSHKISENIYRPFTKEQENIRSKLIGLMREAKNELSDVSPWLDIIVFIKKYDFQNVHNEIFGYVYENYLKEQYEDEKRGQYFTDPAVVNFMLQQLGYTAEEIRRKIKAGTLDELSIVDPACGSGTFLYSATNEIVKSFSTVTSETSKQIEEIVSGNVFGLDVEEFPLYLAEMNILMRMLPLILGEKYNNPVEKKIKVFLTKDSMAEFAGSGLEYSESGVGPTGAQLSYFGTAVKLPYSSYVRDEDDLSEMVQSMTSFPRRRFDYVIANPPYVSYNECARQGVLVFDLLKKGKVKLNNIYGVNLHSIPGSPKKYAPKPNLYAFFLALGLALLKDGARLCFIIPQNILTAGDLDVVRYHLSKYVTINKIVTFSGHLFIERGLRGGKTIPTSSLIIVVTKTAPSSSHQVEITNYQRTDDSMQDTLANIRTSKYLDAKKIKQSELVKNVANWNFIKHDLLFNSLYRTYRRNTLSMSNYYEHSIAQKEFGNRFYFDGGGTVDPKLLSGDGKGTFEVFDYKRNNYDNFNVSISDTFYPKTGKVSFPHGSQGIVTFHQKYKIVWRTRALKKFQFTQRPILLINNQSLVIASNSENEIVYLVALLNSPLNRLVLEKNLRQETEKDFLVSIKSIKEYIRIPKISTEAEKRIKEEIFASIKTLLSLEEKTLSDFVDFSGSLMQRFEEVQVEGNKLVLVHDSRKMELPIKEQTKLVANSIAEQLGGQQSIQEKRHVSLNELRNLPIVDRERQSRLKAYIDDLVFALYFGIPLQALGLKNATAIRKACLANRHYEYVLKG